MREMMVVLGSSGVGGAVGCLAGVMLPGFEPASALLAALGAIAGTAAGILLCVTARPAWSAGAGRLAAGRVADAVQQAACGLVHR